MYSQKDLNVFLSRRIPYSERVYTANLNKLKPVLDEMSAYAVEGGYKESTTVYKHKGKVLRFSRSGSPYNSTHFISLSQLT